jgi:hypothetical protein
MNANTNVVSLQEHARSKTGAHEAGARELDLVGRLFDRIGEDACVPAVVRAELARLRIPDAATAQLERDFVATGCTRRVT